MGIGALREVGIVTNPVFTPDGEGGYIETWVVSPPDWAVMLEPASTRDVERAGMGTITGTAPSLLTGRYRDDVTLKSRIAIGNQVFYVASIQNVEHRRAYLRLIVVESVS